ncbi:MAG TPA: prepilin-type N-terminal cleavage/methylation domain-containing protein [Pyrinomonadaceae bacterium]|nr:prepilin-type N-terminal cleavage/methylation domain-containing protein [Pyrinomonadaceae bacterium]
MTRKTNSGFSLLELMIVLVLVLVVSAAIYRTISLAIERSVTEQTKLDMFQEAREFMDQMARDLRLAGYPNRHNFAVGVLSTPDTNDHRAAVGLVKIAAGELQFEGDVDGSGTVSVIHYLLDSTGTNCPCLKRSHLMKIDASPMAQTTPVYEVEVQGVTNTNIFTAYNNGASVSLPLTFTSNAASIAGLDTIEAKLSLQAATIDPKTKTRPVTTLVTTIKINNCSAAANAQQTSCN